MVVEHGFNVFVAHHVVISMIRQITEEKSWPRLQKGFIILQTKVERGLSVIDVI